MTLDWQPTLVMSFPGTIIDMPKLDGHQLVFCQSDKFDFVYEIVKRRKHLDKRFLFKRPREINPRTAAESV